MSTISGVTPNEAAREVIDESFLAGEEFYRWKDGEATYLPVHLSIDPQGYYLQEEPRGQAMLGEKKRTARDLLLVSDLSPGRMRRCRVMQNLLEPQGLELQGEKEDCYMCLVERIQNLESNVHYIVNPTYTYYAHPDPSVIARWCKCVNRLCYQTAQLNMDLFHQLNKILTKLKWEYVSENGTVEVKKFMKLFNLHRDKKRQVSDVLKQMQLAQDENASLIRADSISLDTLWEFYTRFPARQDIETIFYTKSSNRPFLELKKLVKFLNEEQRDPRKNIQLYPRITQRVTLQLARRYEDDSKLGDVEGEKKLTYDCFHKILMSEHASVIDRNHLTRCEDLSMPLSYFFINSSHNTYLTGNQLASHSSVEMYIQTLLIGCRCVELDCWDGNIEPIITHGNTLCSKILFEDVVRAIADFAFVKSDLPVILSFENHCSTPQQQLMARYCVKYFGENLLDHPLSDYPLGPKAPLPPPSALRYKILIKNKKAHGASDSADTEGAHPPDDEEHETDNIDQHLGDLVNYVEPVKFKSFAVSDKQCLNYQMSSFSELKALDFMQVEGDNFRRYNITHTSRVYPAGGRINSSNYMPQVYWNVGCHMVALNYQTADLSMQLNQAKYEYNGNCGYLRKPELLLNLDDTFDPFSLQPPGNKVPTDLSLKIISAQFLGPSTRDVQVQCELFGLPADTCRGQKHKNKWTKFVPYNGVVAYFEIEKDKTIQFPPIMCEELALLRLTVVDDSGNFLAQRTIPISSLQTGYRHVFLRDRCNHTIPLASLFLHIHLDDYVSPELENFVKMLANPENMKQQTTNLERPDEATFRKEALDALLLGTELENEETHLTGEDDDVLSPINNKMRKKTASSSISSTSSGGTKLESLLEVTEAKGCDRSISPSNGTEPVRSYSESCPRRHTAHFVDNGLMPLQGSRLQRHSEPADTSLPVIASARKRELRLPQPVLVVQRESKEYNRITKQQEKELELLVKSFDKEVKREAQGGRTHIKRMESLGSQIGKLEKENKRLQLSTRESGLIRMKTISNDMGRLREDKQKQDQMFHEQQHAVKLRIHESRDDKIEKQKSIWRLENKNLTRRLVLDNHQKMKDLWILKQHSMELKQFDRDLEAWKTKKIQLLLQDNKIITHMADVIRKEIDSHRAELQRIQEYELKCYDDSSSDIINLLDREIVELEVQLLSLPAASERSISPSVSAEK